MIGKKEANHAGHHRNANRDGDHCADPVDPEPGHRRGQDHDSNRHQRAERMETAHKVQNDQRQKREMR